MTKHNPGPYDFIITGASGNIGRHIIPILARRGRTILAVGRDKQTLHALFTGYGELVAVADYNELAKYAACDTLIHLAVRNNNHPGSLEDFSSVNVGFAAQIGREFARMNGARFLNISSTLLLEGGNQAPYAISKAMGYQKLWNELGTRVDNIYIGYFHDRGYFGEKFSFLRLIGPSLGDALFKIFKPLKATTSAQILADYVTGSAISQPLPKILVDDISRSLIYRSITRTMDIAASVFVLLLLFPLLVIISVVIRLDSPGSIIFKQKRVGMSQETFTLYKFRTMKSDTIAAGTHEISASAVTKIGQFLRRTKLDELPQAVNLLRGDMTLVGPRPCLISQVELIEARQTLGVYTLKPGVTGYSQIRGIDMSRPQSLARSDYCYMKLQSLLLNMRIIVLTALGRGGGDRVMFSNQRQLNCPPP